MSLSHKMKSKGTGSYMSVKVIQRNCWRPWS